MALPGVNHAACDNCELKGQCANGKYVTIPPPPEDFNGIMLLGESPDRGDINRGRLFTGTNTSKVLKWLALCTDIELDKCHLSYTNLCLPTFGAGEWDKNFPNAIHSCLPRLEAEIAAVKPKVIIALGDRALQALTGYEHRYTKLQPAPPCEHCNSTDNPKRTITGVQCAVGDCKHVWEGDDPEAKPEGCPKCAASWKRLKVRKTIKCPVCEGKKRAPQEFMEFRHDYKLGEIAGAPIPGDRNGWDDLGVRYIVPTYPLYRLFRPAPQGAMGGQFLAEPMLKHWEKAIRLVTQDATYSFEYTVTPEHDHVEAARMLREWVSTRPEFTVDVETEAWGTGYRCSVCNKWSKLIEFRIFEDGVTESRTLDCNGLDGCGEKGVVHHPGAKELDARKVPQVSHIKVCGFGVPGNALVVDTRQLEFDEDNPLWQALCEVLEDPDLHKAMHHGNYDVPTIEKLWAIKTDGFTDDTLILHHDLYPDESHGLAHVTFSFTDAPIWKPPKQLHGHEAHETFEELCEYNARDVCLTADVLTAMKHKLIGAGLQDVYKLDMQLEQQGLEMWRNGMPISVADAKKVGAEALGRDNEAVAEMRKILKWDDFNPRSGGQMGEALFKRLGNTPTAWTKGGAPSTDKNVILGLPDTPFKRAILQHKDALAALKNYFDVVNGEALPGRSLHVWNDGRLRAIWKCFGARTGRWSSNPNFQNWQKWLRALVQAPEGYKIVGGDYDQLELRIMAGLSGDPLLIEKCLNADETDKLNPDCDPHSYVALVAFGATFTNLDKDDPKHDKKDPRCRCQKCERKSLRDLCKRVIYGLNYGAGDKKVLESIYEGGYDGPPLTLQMITRIRAAIYRAFEGIPNFQNRLAKEAARDEAIHSPLMRRRRIFPLAEIPHTEILNFPIQSGGADIINQRSTLLWNEAKAKYARAQYIAQVHDACYYLVPEDDAEDMRDLMTECLTWETALYEGGPVIPFTAMGEIADNWKDAG
jgi:uracil-DNA glycosylase family 4